MKVKRLNKDTLQLISKQIRARILMSSESISRRSSAWATAEEQFAAYMPETDADSVRKNKRDSGEPQYTTLVVPYSYAIGMTAHTYYTTVFLARNPVYQFAGRHGEGEMQIQGMEALMDYQLQVGEQLVPLFLWLFDPIKYGHGFVGQYWDEQTVMCRKRVQKLKNFLGYEIPGTEYWEDEVNEVQGYTGHRLFNIRPQDAFPDTRVPIWNFQKGEFFGRYVEITPSELRAGELSGKYFDVPEVVLESQSGEVARDTGGAVTTLPGRIEEFSYLTLDEKEIPVVVKAYEVFVKIIPRDWKLADSTREEIWVFTVTASTFRPFGVQPLGEYHGKFPVDVLVQEPDAYNVFTRSMMEVMAPLNDAITWMVNSHMFNVRAALNNQFVYDPSMISAKDLEAPGPGKAIRLKPSAYGRDVRGLIHQLPVADVTNNHIPGMQMLADFLQRVTGVNDNVMGMVNAGGRKSATEIRQSTTFGINRLKTTCEFWSAMGFAPMTQKMVQGTQQHFNREIQMRVVGDLAGFSDAYMNVTPDLIGGFYDFVPVDGSMPVDRFAQANLWQMMLGQMSKVPQVMERYDLGKMFGWVASLAGLKNIQQFKVQVMAPDALNSAVQAGNIVPLRGNEADLGRPPQQMQVPGMGATA